jgi:hypothetical protein
MYLSETQGRAMTQPDLSPCKGREKKLINKLTDDCVACEFVEMRKPAYSGRKLVL